MDDALVSIQERFSIIDLNAQFYVLDNSQIEDARSGKGIQKYYKKMEGNLLIERYIANSNLGLSSTQIKELIYDFWRSPNTQAYDRVAFDPRPQGKKVLNF